MSAESDKQIADILATYGEPLAGNVWRVQGTAVIYHKTLERIAVQAQIRVKDAVVVRWSAKSQSKRAMGNADFQRSKDAVLSIIDELIGTAPGTLSREAGRAA